VPSGDIQSLDFYVLSKPHNDPADPAKSHGHISIADGKGGYDLATFDGVNWENFAMAEGKLGCTTTICLCLNWKHSPEVLLEVLLKVLLKVLLEVLTTEESQKY
jgi:hypothetical protein